MHIGRLHQPLRRPDEITGVCLSLVQQAAGGREAESYLGGLNHSAELDESFDFFK